MTELPDLLQAVDATQRSLLRRGAPPGPSELMKATLTDARFTDPGWVFERKLDGIRCLATKTGGRVRLRSRNDQDLGSRFPDLVYALEEDPVGDVAVDGEVVAFHGPRTSFARLQQQGKRPGPVFLYAFDLLHLDGWDLRSLPLRRRKALLRSALSFRGPVRFTPHRNTDGEALHRRACERGWEGLIAKRADAPYSGDRSRDWLKMKCSAEQELVVGGYTAPRGSRSGLGALLLGHYDGHRLRYAGKVGTGFTEQTLTALAQTLAPLERGSSPFVDEVREKAVTWVRPELVAQIAFTEWTRDGRLRHPRYLGLREDKAAEEVVRER